MVICKGILSDVKKICKDLDYALNDDIFEIIASKNEEFIIGVLDEASEISASDKRKTVTIEDIKEVIKGRGLEIFDEVFNFWKDIKEVIKGRGLEIFDEIFNFWLAYDLYSKI